MTALLLAGLLGTAPAVSATTGMVAWEPPTRIPSPEGRAAWFPDLAIDERGRIHVVWAVTDHAGSRRAREEGRSGYRQEELYYARREDGRWSPPASIALRQASILRSAIAADGRGLLHLLLDFSPGWGHDLYYRQASSADGFVGSWTRPARLNTRWSTYLSDVAIRGDTVHVVYDDAGALDAACPGCGDVYYRRSDDRGTTWAPLVSLRPSPIGSGRAQLAIDAAGALYVAWDEGRDHWSGAGEPEHGVFTASFDGGDTWLEPLVVSHPAATNVQLAPGATGDGRIVLVWRATTERRLFHMASADWGETWSAPAPVEGLEAAPWTSPFDVYAIATDAGGTVHLLACGYPAGSPARDRGLPHGLYHLRWDGGAWSSPAVVYDGPGYPEYPRLVVHAGDELHATFFTRAQPTGDQPPHQIWYVRGRSARGSSPLAARLPPARARPHRPVPERGAPVEAPREKPTPWVRWNALLLFAASLVAGGVIVALVRLTGLRR